MIAGTDVTQLCGCVPCAGQLVLLQTGKIKTVCADMVDHAHMDAIHFTGFAVQKTAERCVCDIFRLLTNLFIQFAVQAIEDGFTILHVTAQTNACQTDEALIAAETGRHEDHAGRLMLNDCIRDHLLNGGIAFRFAAQLGAQGLMNHHLQG